MNTSRYSLILIVSFAASVIAGCSSNSCEMLEYDEVNNTCVCPGDSEPDYELDACVYPNGELIPWGDLDVAYRDRDAGSDGGLAFDAGTLDGSADMSMSDMGLDGLDAGLLDAGAPPPPTSLRYPWNGFLTGSVHVPNDAPIADHPLRPKLTWETIPSASHYHVQMTTECSADSFRDCTFDSPELDETTFDTTYWPAESLTVAREVPVGSRYFWRVQTCNASSVCSRWTPIRYLDVGRDKHDLNGDGYADVVVGAENMLSGRGAAFVFLGNETGPISAPSITLNGPGNRRGDSFGHDVECVGDVDGDGFSDLLIGAPGALEVGAYLYSGGPAGPSPTRVTPLPSPTASSGGYLFGAAVAGIGDVNGDGFADVVIGDKGRNFSLEFNAQGSAFVFLGNSAGLPDSPSLILDDHDDRTTFFGTSLAGVGDLNGDGFVDMVVGASANARRRGGSAHVFFGGSDPLAMSIMLRGSERGADSALNFGWSVTGAGDLNADGYADLAVADVNEGLVHLFFGASTAMDTLRSVTVLDSPIENFGWAVSFLRDANGDGFSEVVGSEMSTRGSAYVLTGSEFPGAEFSVRLLNPLDQPGRFGNALSDAGDVNGDGYSDLVVGAWRQDWPENNEGTAYVFFGGPDGMGTTAGVSIDNPLDEAASLFGVSVD